LKERLNVAEQKSKMLEMKLQVTQHKLNKMGGQVQEDDELEKLKNELKQKDIHILKLETNIKSYSSGPLTSSTSLSDSGSDVSGLKDTISKLEAEIKKAHMQGRIAQKREEKTRTDQLLKSQEEYKLTYEQFISKMRFELEAEQATLKNSQEQIDKVTSELRAFEMRYVKAEHILKEQDKFLKDILNQLKTQSNVQSILHKIPPHFETVVPLRENHGRYGVPVIKQK